MRNSDVPLKSIPKCPGYGASANCPPHAMTVDQVREVVDNFTSALFIEIDIPPEKTAGKKLLPSADLNHHLARLAGRRKTANRTADTKSMAEKLMRTMV